MSTGFGRKGLDSLAGDRVSPGQGAPAFAAAQRTPAVASSPMASARKFDITPKRMPFIAAILFFGACTPVMLHLLLDPRGVIINGIIDLGPFGANVFFGVLLCVTLGLVALGAMGLIASFSGNRTITVDLNAFTAPASPISRKTTRMAFADIKNMSMTEAQGYEWVTIKDRKGQAVKIGGSDFQDENKFVEFLDLVAERMER